MAATLAEMGARRHAPPFVRSRVGANRATIALVSAARALRNGGWVASAQAVAALVLGAGCGPAPAPPFTVPAHCVDEAMPITMSGPAAGSDLPLHYGLQGGQHVYAPIVLRGVDPTSTSVRLTLTRERDGATVADQVFTFFFPGEDPCDVALPHTEFFVQTPLADGWRASLRIAVFDPPRSASFEVDGLCVSSGDGCDEHPALALRVGGHPVAPGDRVYLDDDGTLLLSVEGAPEGAVLWGRADGQPIEQRASAPVAIPAADRRSLELALVLAAVERFGGGVLGVFDGRLEVGCSPLAPPPGCTCEVPDDAAGVSRCRAAGTRAVGEPCTRSEDCVGGASCAAGTCRAYCDPATPACAAGERCRALAQDLGLCEPGAA